MSHKGLTHIPVDERGPIRRRLRANSAEAKDGCIVWTGRVDDDGYAHITVHVDDETVRHTSAHRAAWLISRGDISDPSLVLDHLCRNPACINTDHLEPVTNRENTLRGNAAQIRTRGAEPQGYVRLHPLKTHCIRGHELSGENVRPWMSPRTGYVSRFCRSCERLRNGARSARLTA